MKNTPFTTATLLALTLVFVGCGDDDAGVAPEPAPETPVEPAFVPTRLEDSAFLSLPELEKTTPEIAEGIYVQAEAILTAANLLEAAKSMASPPALELLGQWEKDPIHIVASHFGQTRFIIAFAGTSTGNVDRDFLIARELQTNLSAHARKVILEIVANTELKPKPVRPPKPVKPEVVPIQPEVLPKAPEAVPVKPEILPPDPE